MNYKLLFLLLLIFLVYSLQSIIKPINAIDEVSEEIRLHVSILDLDLSMLINGSTCGSSPDFCVDDAVNVTSNLTNTGNFNVSGNLITRIFNRTFEIHRETWNDVNLSIGEIEYHNTTYKIKDKDMDYSLNGPEVFNAISNYSFDGKFNTTGCSFRVKKGIGNLRRFPAQIIDTIPPGRTKIHSAYLWLDEACKGTNATLNKTEGIPDDWLSFSQDRLYLVPNEINTTDVNITIPPLTRAGVYDNGTIFAYADGQRIDIGLNITVGFIDFIINVTTQEKTVCPGRTIPATINITKILPAENVNVNITYQIIDYNQTVYDERKEYNITISNTSLQELYTLTAPSSAKVGYYVFLVTIEYNSTLTQYYDTFEVISCIPPISQPGPNAGEEEPIPPSKLALREIMLNLSAETLVVITGNKTSFIATVKNTGTEAVKSVKISVEGLPSEWIRIFPTTVDLDVGEVEDYLVVINVPTNATPEIYKLNIKATNSVESNTVILTLIIGKDPKEIAELLLKELGGIRAKAKESLLIEDCMDITVMKTSYQEAEMSFEKGMKEYNSKNYEGAINWFEYALPIEKKVVNKVDITLELEVETTNRSKFLIPPFYKSQSQFQLAGTYLQEKNYGKICDPLEKIRRYILIGLIFWPGLAILLIILLILIVIFLKKRKGKEKLKTLERVRERLGISNA